ncbi:DMT family transporter [Roseomonas gilardii]|uniref:DMT family transporter n=1 Tax=Roseomonas gilardii TaxID=257708 RepID=UPI0011AAA2DE|nr:DMT family transporter [Roseomonas gilardii]
MSSTEATAPKLVDDAVRGIGFVALSYLVFSLSDASMKWALPELGTAGAMIWRGLFGTLSVAFMAGVYRPGGLARIWPSNKRIIFWRGVLNVVATALYYVAWRHGLALGDTYAVAATAPLMLTLLAIPMLGETVGWRRWTSTGIGFLGVLFMFQPGGALWGLNTVLILAAVAMLAMTRIWTRVLARTDKPTTITFWLMFGQLPAGLLMLPFFPLPEEWPSLFALALVAMCGLAHGLAHYLLARGYAMAPVSTLAPLEYTPILWGTALGFLIWGDMPAWTTFAGAGVVVCAGLYNLHRERIRAREKRQGGSRGGGKSAAVPAPLTARTMA